VSCNIVFAELSLFKSLLFGTTDVYLILVSIALAGSHLPKCPTIHQHPHLEGLSAMRINGSLPLQTLRPLFLQYRISSFIHPYPPTNLEPMLAVHLITTMLFHSTQIHACLGWVFLVALYQFHRIISRINIPCLIHPHSPFPSVKWGSR
jgi:hypothetical protein